MCQCVLLHRSVSIHSKLTSMVQISFLFQSGDRDSKQAR